jgi:histidinol phosphatase-like PHP family hydrolase
MGVDNDVKVILGVEYSYDHKGTINCANEIGICMRLI